MTKLSILIPSLVSRDISRILERLKPQLTDKVEVLSLVDNKKRTLSEKRNNLISLAQWDYVCFIDDDDDISDDYVSEILNAILNDTDVIVFDVEVRLNNLLPKPCYYSKVFKYEETELCYHRLPNDKMVFKRSIASQVKYKNILCEDTVWSNDVLDLIKTESHISKTLYYYIANSTTSECQWSYDESFLNRYIW